MEEYQVLTNLPEEYHFGNWDKKDVKAFGKWFMAEKDNRMQMLFDEVHRDPDFVDWQPDFSPESLKMLSYWFERHIQAESMPEDEYQKLIAKYIVMAEYKNNWLTKKSKSLIFDVSIYFGEVLLKELGDREWEQYIYVSKNNYEYGYMSIPVIPAPKHKWTVTPWRNISVLASKVIYTNSFKKDDIYTIFEKTLNVLKSELLKLPSNKETPENK